MTNNVVAWRLTWKGYKQEKGRGAALFMGWAVWVSKRVYGHCIFTLAMLSFPIKMTTHRVDQGCEGKTSQSG